MPIEIRELVIRAVVDPHDHPAPDARDSTNIDREALIEACVDEALRILRRSKER